MIRNIHAAKRGSKVAGVASRPLVHLFKMVTAYENQVERDLDILLKSLS